VIRKFSRFAALLLTLLVPVWAAAADVALKDFDGKTRQASEFLGKGKWTVVAVWSADCPICKAEIFHMTFLYDEHKNKDIDVLGLSIDGYANRKKARQFVDDQGLNFPNLIGEPDDASLLSGTMFIGTPTYYFFSPEGKFAGQHIGPVTQEIAEKIILQLKTERPKQGKG
jgi:thiol-disulfide isomerase/thioredoxin